MDITATIFNDHRLSKISMDCMGSVALPYRKVSFPIIKYTLGESIYSPISIFQRTIKKDAILFPTLKDYRYQDV
jgi:hypothetical protein